jgi:MoaA/NifB/PqqE/SkfB family radical SAM enzyme
MIKSEMRRKAFPGIKEKLSFIFLAITRKCPLRCEHCFEWDNLNKKETFTKQDLIKIIDLYQQEGVLQIHFSGGEPMVRINDLVDLIKYSSPKSECWVLTSGFNFTPRNALILKEAGCTGVVVSIDHYIPELHNKFRGHNNSFEMAVGAVKAAKAAGLVTSVSVCATRAFIDGKHLMPYLHFVKQLGVQFVQVLEPEQTGNYEGKDVLLNKSQVHELEEIYKRVNHSPAFWHYPTIIYHGYHERRIGCFSGSRRVYIDSAGDVHACPFCHTKAYNVIELLRNHKKELPQMEIACQLFNKIA